MVEDRYVMNPSPIPRYDNWKLNDSETLYLFGAGREKKIYAIPPHTKVVSMCFEDVPFRTEDFEGKRCRLCGAAGCIWTSSSTRRQERKYTNAMTPDSVREDGCAIRTGCRLRLQSREESV